MKKILAILTSVGVTATAGLSVVACGKTKDNFNTFMDYVNETKGKYDDEGNVIEKSSASVIYIGAKDNASSQSFEYALSQTFGSVDSAKTALSKETQVTKTQTYSLNKEIKENKITLASGEGTDLTNVEQIKVEVKNGDDWESYDATIGSDNVITLLEKTANLADGTYELKLTGYTTSKNNESDKNKRVVINGWTTAYNNWLINKNDDRAITGIDLNLDPSSKTFGKVSNIEKADPVYGINKGSSDKGIITNAYDYAKIKFSLKTITVNKISDYWNTSLFNKIVNNYLKKDLMYQIAANSSPKGGDKNPEYLGWQDKVDNSINNIKSAKGPLFLIVKNGHIVKIMKGWNRYTKFGFNSVDKDNQATYTKDLVNWSQEIANIFNQSFQDNNPNNQFNEIKGWGFATRDDNGTSNWDPKEEKSTDNGNLDPGTDDSNENSDNNNDDNGNTNEENPNSTK